MTMLANMRKTMGGGYYRSLLIAAAVLCGASAAWAMPSISGTEETVTVTVPAGEVSSPCGVILCWDDSFAGEAVADWPHSHVLTTNGLTSAGGAFSVSAAELGLVRGQCLRAFIVPGEFKCVEYVECVQTLGSVSRSVYFDTGVSAVSGVRVESEMMWLGHGDTSFCGARYSSGTMTRMFMIHNNNGKWYQGYGGNAWTTTYDIDLDTRYLVDSRLYNGLQRLTVTDVAAETTTVMNDMAAAIDVDPQARLYVFAAHYPGQDAADPTFAGVFASARCYWLKLYENGDPADNIDGDLVRDYVPVKDYFGRGALFERQSGTLYLAQYSGAASTSRHYATCGDETGEAVVGLQTELVMASCGGYYLEDGVKASANSSRISVNVLPGVVYGETNALAVCWGDRDYGDQAADWPNILAEMPLVGQDGGTFDFPVEGIGPGSFVRAFLVGTIGLADYISSEDNASSSSISVYLDTGVKMKHGLRVETRIEWLEKWQDFGFMGARPDSGNTRFLPIYGYLNGQWGMAYGTGNWNRGGFEVDTPYDVEAKLYAGEQRLTVDGDGKYAGTSTWAPDYDINVFAFAVNWYAPAQGTPNYGCRAKCHYLRMYTDGDTTDNPDGTLARDYVPAVVEGVAGMFDLLDGSFTASAGTGSFKYGSVTNTIGFAEVTYRASEARQASGGGFFIIVR